MTQVAICLVTRQRTHQSGTIIEI